MLILSWGEEQKKGSITVKTETVQETGPVSTSAVFIPRGKYFTIAQVAEIGNVKERTVSTWLKKGLLKGLDLPKLGQIVKEKDLEKYLKEKLYKP